MRDVAQKSVVVTSFVALSALHTCNWILILQTRVVPRQGQFQCIIPVIDSVGFPIVIVVVLKTSTGRLVRLNGFL
jgi:hypothetical protein